MRTEVLSPYKWPDRSTLAAAWALIFAHQTRNEAPKGGNQDRGSPRLEKKKKKKKKEKRGAGAV